MHRYRLGRRLPIGIPKLGMGIRVRLVLVFLAVAIPLILGWLWLHDHFVRDTGLSARATLWGALALVAGLLGALLLAVGPILRRIGRLTRDVEIAAKTQYDKDIRAEGSDEIAALAHAFNAAGESVRTQMSELSAREETLRAFVANTTHDVMTPLTVLQGHLMELKRNQARREANDIALDAITEELLIRSSIEETHYLGSLVQNLGALAKLDADQIEISEHNVDLVELAQRAIARHRPLGLTRSIVIDAVLPPEPVVVRGDVTLLEQAVSNIISNAVRYNQDGGRVIVVLEARIGTKHFCLRIFDDGPGVSDDELARLTERRFRGAEARTRTPDGSGLGLSIARDVIERHGWTLTMGPVPWGGLEVVLEGPLTERS